MTEIANNCKSYSNMHESALKAMEYCSELTLDIVAFSVLTKLAEITETHFDNEGNYNS